MKPEDSQKLVIGFRPELVALNRSLIFSTISSMTHRPDNGGTKDLWNVGNLLTYYTAQ